MADEELSQAPMVVLPYSLRSSMFVFFESYNMCEIMKPRLPLDADNLNGLATSLAVYGDIYKDGVRYLHELAVSTGKAYSPPSACTWLRDGRRHFSSDALEPYPSRINASIVPMKMQVSFRKRGGERWEAHDQD
jgi:hypothetical protein